MDSISRSSPSLLDQLSSIPQEKQADMEIKAPSGKASFVEGTSSMWGKFKAAFFPNQVRLARSNAFNQIRNEISDKYNAMPEFQKKALADFDKSFQKGQAVLADSVISFVNTQDQAFAKAKDAAGAANKTNIFNVLSNPSAAIRDLSPITTSSTESISPAPEISNATHAEIQSALSEIRDVLRDVSKSYNEPITLSNRFSTIVGKSTPETKLASRMEEGYQVAGVEEKQQLSPLAKRIIKDTQAQGEGTALPGGWIGNSLRNIQGSKGEGLEDAMNDTSVLRYGLDVIKNVAANDSKKVIDKMVSEVEQTSATTKATSKEVEKAITEITTALGEVANSRASFKNTITMGAIFNRDAKFEEKTSGLSPLVKGLIKNIRSQKDNFIDKALTEIIGGNNGGKLDEMFKPEEIFGDSTTHNGLQSAGVKSNVIQDLSKKAARAFSLKL